MTQEITNELRAKIFGLYLGCNIIGYPYFKNTSEKDKYPAKGILMGVNTQNLLVHYRDINGYKWEDKSNEIFEDIKLVLSALSDITDEDAIEVAKLNGLANPTIATKGNEAIFFHSDNAKGKLYFRGLLFRYEVAKGKYNGVHSCLLDSYDYLRSKYYHLPYMGIDLYEAGLAVKAEKV